MGKQVVSFTVLNIIHINCVALLREMSILLWNDAIINKVPKPTIILRWAIGIMVIFLHCCI